MGKIDNWPSLGDKLSKLKLVTLEEPLADPPNKNEKRKAIVHQFERILNQGTIQKIVFEVGRPVTYSKYIPVDLPDAIDPVEVPTDDIVSAARNVEMVIVDKSDTLDSLLTSFNIINKNRLRPVALVTGNIDTLKTWLGVDASYDLSSVFGLECRHAADIPSDALLMVAGAFEDPAKIEYCVRITMNVKEN